MINILKYFKRKFFWLTVYIERGGGCVCVVKYYGMMVLQTESLGQMSTG